MIGLPELLIVLGIFALVGIFLFVMHQWLKEPKRRPDKESAPEDEDANPAASDYAARRANFDQKLKEALNSQKTEK